MPDPTAVVALVGPTGSGKSRVALQAASGRAVEIVAVDAFTVYRGMSIGTAKPTPAARDRVPHHLVDLLDVEQECHAAWFQRTARAAIEDIHRRGRLPLLVGGSGLYFRAVVDALEFPPTDATVRAELLRRHAADPAAAHALLGQRDPAAAALIEPGNVRRTVRALEVLELTGRPFSSYRTAWQAYDSIYPGLQVIGVDLPPPELAASIAARTQRMLAAGWLPEARRLRGRALSRSARQAIGYAELFDHLDGRLTLEQATEAIVTRTRRYAARQRRWFRRDPRVSWVSGDRVAAELTARCGWSS